MFIKSATKKGKRRNGKIIGQTIKNEEILLDGSTIEDSTLEGCTLIFRGSQPFSMIGSRIIHCQIIYDGYAALTLQTIKGMQDSGLPTGVTFNERLLNSF